MVATIFLGATVAVTTGCLLSLLGDLLEIDNLRYSPRLAVVVTQLVLLMSAVAWWGICVMRACVHRTGRGKSVVVSGVFFLSTLYYLSMALAALGGNAKALTEDWYAAATNGWATLEVWADPALGRIVVKGDITHDSDRLFDRVVQTNPEIKVVQIESYGGYVNEAMAMATLVRSKRLDTVTFEHCASACTLMFVAGGNRYMGPEARFGFHRAGYAGMPASTTLDETDLRMAAFYGSMGAEPEIGLGALATPHRGMWIPSQDVLMAANYATLRWSERQAGM